MVANGRQGSTAFSRSYWHSSQNDRNPAVKLPPLSIFPRPAARPLRGTSPAKQRPRRLSRATGAKAGVGARHALFPKCRTFGAFTAAGSPTLFSTASGVVGLAAGPSASLRTTDSRVRPLCPLLPAVAPPVGGQGSDTGVTCDPRLNRFSPGRPRLLALRWPGVDGSDLLSLRLPSVDLPAVRFVASPDLTEGFPPCLAGPPRCKRPLCHIFRCGLGSVLN